MGSAGNKPTKWDDALTGVSKELYDKFLETKVAKGESQLVQTVGGIDYIEKESDRNDRVLYEKSLAYSIAKTHVDNDEGGGGGGSKSFLGYWNAATNTPEITQGEGSEGNFYLVSDSGTWENISFLKDDAVFFDGNSWKLIDMHEATRMIDDNSVSNQKLWTSDKINREISTKASIDDSAQSIDKTYSSNKIESVIAGVINDNEKNI